MDDLTPFDRQIAAEFLRDAGPSEPVDDLAIFESVTAASRSQNWGFDMLSALKFVAAAVIVTLFGGFLLAGILTTPPDGEMAPAAVTESPSPMATDELAFPTGTFVEADSGYSPRLVFRDDGTFQRSIIGTHGAEGTYSVEGNLYTELTNNSDTPGGDGPASYRWAWDGEHLRFSPMGSDEDGYRQSIYTDHVYVLDPGAVSSDVRRLMLSHMQLDDWVTVEIREGDDGRYVVTATIDEEPLGEGVGDTLEDAVKAALEPLGEPYASDLAATVEG